MRYARRVTRIVVMGAVTVTSLLLAAVASRDETLSILAYAATGFTAIAAITTITLYLARSLSRYV